MGKIKLLQGSNFGDIEELRQDLYNTFLFAAFLVVALGTMIGASSPDVISLGIPVHETLFVAFAAFMVSILGLYLLRLGLPVYPLAWGSLVLYTLIVTATIHYTGGPLTPMPALYILIVVGASFLLGRLGAIVIASLGGISYAIMLYLEHTGILEMVSIWGDINFQPSEKGQLFIINWLAIFIPTFVTALLAGSLAERLKITNENLRESERLRDNLTHMIVHDLRNPITAVMGGLDLLRMMLGKNLNQDQIRLLDNSRHSSGVLLHLVNDILDINKMEAGKFKLNLEPVDLGELAGKTGEPIRVLSEIEGQNFYIDVSESLPQVACDAHIISRVITNLLSNAIKHTPEGGNITLAVRSYDSDTVAISVADTGRGIPLAYREHIFEKFGQVEGDERRGTGLGLTFCKMMVEAHDGHIWVESEVGTGSTFAFTLPIDGPPPM